MSNIAGLYECDSGLVLLNKASAHESCKGCYFFVDLGDGGEDCLKGGSLPFCEHMGASLIYIKLGDK